MTFDECQKDLDQIRRRQGTDRPLIRVDFAGSSYRGMLARADSDTKDRSRGASPFGVLVLEEPGLVHGAQTILQIASISRGAIREPGDN